MHIRSRRGEGQVPVFSEIDTVHIFKARAIMNWAINFLIPLQFQACEKGIVLSILKELSGLGKSGKASRGAQINVVPEVVRVGVEL